MGGCQVAEAGGGQGSSPSLGGDSSLNSGLFLFAVGLQALLGLLGLPGSCYG